MTKEELHKAFLEDFSALLKKYDAELCTEFRSFALDSWDEHVINFNGIYEGENKREYSQLDLPKYLD